MNDAPREPALPQLFTAAEVARALQQTERFVQEKVRLHEWPHRRGARGAALFTAADYDRILELIAVPVAAPAATRLAFAPGSRNRLRS